MNIVLLAQVMKRSAAAATSRSRRILTLTCCLVLFVLVFRFSTVQVFYFVLQIAEEANSTIARHIKRAALHKRKNAR